MGSRLLVTSLMRTLIKVVLMLFHRLGYKLLNLKAIYYSIIFKKCGSNFKLWGECYIKNPQYIEIGDKVSINDGAYLNGKGGIKIGNDVSISAGAIIVSTMLSPSSFLNEKEHLNKKIIIGNNVQVGAGAIILAGTTIGDNVIIGAGSVLTKSTVKMLKNKL